MGENNETYQHNIRKVEYLDGSAIMIVKHSMYRNRKVMLLNTDLGGARQTPNKSTAEVHARPKVLIKATRTNTELLILQYIHYDHASDVHRHA